MLTALNESGSDCVPEVACSTCSQHLSMILQGLAELQALELGWKSTDFYDHGSLHQVAQVLGSKPTGEYDFNVLCLRLAFHVVCELQQPDKLQRCHCRRVQCRIWQSSDIMMLLCWSHLHKRPPKSLRFVQA